MDPSRWARWQHLVASAREEAALADTVATLATEAGHAVASPTLRWSAIGVEVRRKRLRGRLGGIVHRWDRRVALVDDRLTLREEEFVAAHEVGHMVLSRAIGISTAGAEERLCDLFAESLLRAAGRPTPDRPRAAS